MRRPLLDRVYGAGPAHLLGLVGCLAASAYVVSLLLDDRPVLVRIGSWFVGAAVVWDLLLGPALALVDRALRRVLGPGGVNYVRVPALVSGALLLVWAPMVLGRAESTYESKTGLAQDVHLERWLAVTGVLFAGSAVTWAVARVRAGRRAGVAAG